MNFIDKLNNAAKNHNSLLCVGLDPDPDIFPDAESISNSTGNYRRYCRPGLRLQTQFRFIWALGTQGFSALKETVDYVPQDIP